MNKFEETCKAMGGKYEVEEGYLEPEVGVEHIETHEARKQWCTLKNKPSDKGEITIFNARNTFDISIRGEGYKNILDVWDNDVKKNFIPEKAKMIFKTELGTRIPKGKYIVVRYPNGELEMRIKPYDDPLE